MKTYPDFTDGPKARSRRKGAGRPRKYPPGTLLAYHVDLDGVRVVVFAVSRGAARMAAVLSARDAGFLPRRPKYWPRIRAWRAQEYDGHPNLATGPRYRKNTAYSLEDMSPPKL